jgi:hypothetical protein
MTRPDRGTLDHRLDRIHDRIDGLSARLGKLERAIYTLVGVATGTGGIAVFNLISSINDLGK